MTAALGGRPGRFLVIILTLLCTIGPISIDMYLPAMPGLAREFNAGPGTVQLTLSLFLIGFAFAQLIYGPLSDRFGRRPVILGGLLVFVAATILCAYARSIEELIVARILQAMGACAGPVLARAVVRDLWRREDAARVLSVMAGAMAVAPAIAPVVGGWLLLVSDWRAIFWALAGFVAMLLGLCSLGLRETNPHPDPLATRPGRLLANARHITVSRVFWGYVLTFACAYSGLFSFLSGAPFVLIELFGIPADQFGYYFLVPVFGYMAGTLLSSRLSPRLGLDRTIAIGLGIIALAAGTMALLGWLRPGIGWHPGVVAIVAPIGLYMIGTGLIMPNAMAGALGPFATMAGAASAVMGFVQMVLAALFGGIVGHSFDGSERAMVTALGIAALGAVLATLLLRPDRGPISP